MFFRHVIDYIRGMKFVYVHKRIRHILESKFLDCCAGKELG